MSTFGSPGGQNFISKPSPPQRGSFPLDHDGECKSQMSLYLTCLRRNRGVNIDECRLLSKDYLECRMERNLMARDEMKNLGYAAFAAAAGTSKEEVAQDSAMVAEKGAKSAAPKTAMEVGMETETAMTAKAAGVGPLTAGPYSRA